MPLIEALEHSILDEYDNQGERLRRVCHAATGHAAREAVMALVVDWFGTRHEKKGQWLDLAVGSFGGASTSIRHSCTQLDELS